VVHRIRNASAEPRILSIHFCDPVPLDLVPFFSKVDGSVPQTQNVNLSKEPIRNASAEARILSIHFRDPVPLDLVPFLSKVDGFVPRT